MDSKEHVLTVLAVDFSPIFAIFKELSVDVVYTCPPLRRTDLWVILHIALVSIDRCAYLLRRESLKSWKILKICVGNKQSEIAYPRPICDHLLIGTHLSNMLNKLISMEVIIIYDNTKLYEREISYEHFSRNL